MVQRFPRLLRSGAVLALLGACASSDATAKATTRVLLYQKETFWYHPSNTIAGTALKAACEAKGLAVEVTKDSSVFSKENLERFDVVVFLLTSGPTMNAAERYAFHRWVANHHGVVGVHSAAFTDADDPYMGEMFGASFFGHPPQQSMATVDIVDGNSPITRPLPRPYVRSDEWYTFDRRPELQSGVHVLLALNEKSAGDAYPGPDAAPGLAVGYHPLSWTIERASSRVYYTGMGHKVESWAEPSFVEMVTQGILWASETRQR